MLSYQNDSSLKARFLGHVRQHEEQDRVLQGTYGKEVRGEWKGCAVACSLRSLDEIEGITLVDSYADHTRLSARLGVPLELVHLEDRIFEGLSKADAKGWPARFAESVPVGSDLSLVWPKLAFWLLSDETDGVLRLANTERTRKTVEGAIALYRRWVDGNKPSFSEWREARKTADADGAADAAASYAAAASSYAADAAAASSYAASYAADAAAAASYAAAAASYAAARKAHWLKIGNKLCELMAAA